MDITLETAEAIADAADAEVYEDYSGRGMYGEKCLGFVVDGNRGYARLAAAITRTLNDASAYVMLDRVRTDSLGLRTIAYFPGINATASAI